MPYEYYPDPNGDTIKLYEEDGRLFHFHVPHWDDSKRIMSQEDDVLICSYPKSGTHWLWEIVHMLKTGKTEVTSMDMKDNLLCVAHPDAIKQLASPRVLVAHRHFHDLPSDFIIKKRKMVLMLRDPKDVCVSFYNFLPTKVYEYTGTFNGFLTLFLQGRLPFNRWSSWVKSYEKGFREHPELTHHVIHYERLTEDPVNEIRRLAEYLQVDPALADTVAQQTQFSIMRNIKIQADEHDLAQFFDDNQFNTHLYRKGKSGGWKEWFNEEQQTWFDKAICEQLGRSSIEPLL